MSRNRVLLPGPDGLPEPGSLRDGRVRPGTIFTLVQAATLRPTALPLMGRYADDSGALDRTQAPAPPPRGNRRQRRAQAKLAP